MNLWRPAGSCSGRLERRPARLVHRSHSRRRTGMRRLCPFQDGFRAGSHYGDMAARTNGVYRSISVRPVQECNRRLNRCAHGDSKLLSGYSFGVKQAEHIQTRTHVSVFQPAEIDLLRVRGDDSLAFFADRADGTICSEGVEKHRSGGVGQKELVSCSRSVEERFRFGCRWQSGRRATFGEFAFTL